MAWWHVVVCGCWLGIGARRSPAAPAAAPHVRPRHACHRYIEVADVEDAAVRGLKGLEYLDKVGGQGALDGQGPGWAASPGRGAAVARSPLGRSAAVPPRPHHRLQPASSFVVRPRADSRPCQPGTQDRGARRSDFQRAHRQVGAGLSRAAGQTLPVGVEGVRATAIPRAPQDQVTCTCRLSPQRMSPSQRPRRPAACLQRLPQGP